MTVKRSTTGFLACGLAAALLSACGSAGEKVESLAVGSVHEALPEKASRSAALLKTNRVYSVRAARALEAIRVEAKLPEGELKRLSPVAQTAAHAQALIDRIEDPAERERARSDLGLAVDRSLGSALNRGQIEIVHRHILANNNP